MAGHSLKDALLFYPALYTKASMCCIIKYQDNQEQEIVIVEATKLFTMIDDIVKKIQKSDDVTQEDGEKMIGQLTRTGRYIQRS